MQPPPTKRRISILTSTGSIGESALAVVRHYPEWFEVVALGANTQWQTLAEQVREFKPKYVAVADSYAAEKLAAEQLDVEILSGVEGLNEAARVPVDVVLCAVVGAAGLHPLLSAIGAGNRVAVANKEPFVMAGKLVMEEARKRGVAVLPVDSEHNAIFQCLHGHRLEDVQCVHLTASGGPFYGQPREALAAVTPEQAVRHPTWNMGEKISVDSATLMNKGLEIVEAMWLFGLREDQINVVIHPQSIVHSMVEYRDGNILAQLGVTDMRFPILFALTWPERAAKPMERLNLTRMNVLTFAEPDFAEFPCLALARRAAAEGGTATAILNAANETAVAAFRKHHIPFLSISDVVGATLDACPSSQDHSLESVLDADARARQAARDVIEQIGTLA
jgi:1-deoxy-D-xylulose-5-phosphate reductoisomerase